MNQYMNHFKILNKSGKIRLIIFILLMGFLVYLAVGYSAELFQTVRYGETSENVSSTGEEITIDGEDFSWLFLPMKAATFGIIFVITVVAYEVVIIVASFLCLCIFRLAAFRKTTEIQQEEYILGKQIQQVLCIGSTAVSVLLTALATPVFGFIGIAFNLPLLLFSRLFYILPMKKRIRDSEQSDDDIA